MSQVLVLPASQQFFNLVGGIPTPLKNHGVKVSWDSSSQSMQSHNPAMFQSPPTRVYTIIPYNYGKSPFLNGKSPFLMGFPCSSHHQPMKSPWVVSPKPNDPNDPNPSIRHENTQELQRQRQITGFRWDGNVFHLHLGAETGSGTLARRGVSSKPWGNYKG